MVTQAYPVGQVLADTRAQVGSRGPLVIPELVASLGIVVSLALQDTRD